MVDQSTVRRILQLFECTGTVTENSYPDSHVASLRKLAEAEQLQVMELVIEKPGSYLNEITWELEKTIGTAAVSEGTVCRLEECGFT